MSATNLFPSRKWEAGRSRPPISRRLCVPLLFWLRFDSRGLGDLATAKLLRRLHKYLRIFLQPFLNTGVSFQKLLEFGMIFLEFLAVGQPGIVGKLLRNNRMTAKEFTEVIHIPASRIVIAVVLDPVEVLFLPHETVRVSVTSSRTPGCCCRYSCSAGCFSTNSSFFTSEGSLRSCSAISG